MARWRKFRKLKFVAIIASLAAGAPAAAAPVFSNIFVFGDSLTDTGNAHLGAPSAGVPDPAPPALGYFNGRFSNGPMWTDYLSQDLGFGLLEPRLAGGTNYSVGGARAVPNGDPSLDFPQQLQFFANDLAGGPADPNALYVVNFGGNDARDILHGDADAPDPASVIATIIGGIEALNDLGARHFLVGGIPNIGLQPEQNGAEAEGRALSLQLAAALDAALADLTLEAGTNLFSFDYFPLTDAIEANPTAFGFTQPLDLFCLAVPGASPDCPGFLFFDPLHPTTAAHRLIANAALAALNDATEVPEPATVALLGLGVLGMAAHRRKRPASGLAA